MFDIAIVLIAAIVFLQLFTFVSTRNKLRDLRLFFPNNFNNLEVRKFSIPKDSFKDNATFGSFLNSVNKDYPEVLVEDDGDKEEVEVLVMDDETKYIHQNFNEVIFSTNAYLCKNKGASADFNILQDICERHIQRLDNSIGNLINVPLYIGLAGTFIGIIIGLLGIDFTSANASISPESINQLLKGVSAAMASSLFGLGLTVWNTAMNYKPAVYQNDTDKNHYYDFIQRELLPVLSVGMAGSLSSFKDILGNFIVKFGGDTVKTAALLNDNLSKQQLVLEEINKLSLTRTSTTIAETFVHLKNSSDQLKMFLEYQTSLNQNVTEANKVVVGLNDTLSSFKSFNTNLEAIAKNVNSSIELQRQFKEMLELHFPTIKDHREVWRVQVDELNTDIRGVYGELNKYFQESTGIIQSFVENNENYFTGLNDMQHAITILVKSAEIQNDQFKSLNKGMYEMRQDFSQTQQSNNELNKELIEAIKGLTLKISKLEVITTQETNNGKN